MKVGDIVELIDETDFGGRWAGLMTIDQLYPHLPPDLIGCVHPVLGKGAFHIDLLVVMEEYTDD